MKTIAFIIPYIGKLPNNFQLWLNTCRHNPTIDFLLFTDDRTEYDYPKNVKTWYMSLEEMKSLFQEKFDFHLAIDRPYKFCDFRPAYGEIFSEYLSGYDFWGHCDIDLLWGNMRKFLTDEILENYDRIYSRGHCSLYRNSEVVNAWYRTLPNNGYQDWKEVFQTPLSRCFDEWAGHCGGGISFIIKTNGIDIYDEVDSADIVVKKGKFEVNRWKSQYKKLFFHYIDGSLFACTKTFKKEVMCVHFQKRTLKILNTKDDEYYLVAPWFVCDDVQRHPFLEIEYSVSCFLNRLKRKISR